MVGKEVIEDLNEKIQTLQNNQISAEAFEEKLNEIKA